MPEHGESRRDAQGGSRAPNEAQRGSPLTPNIRRHLGGALRAAYAARPAEPPGERIEALLSRLCNARTDGAPD